MEDNGYYSYDDVEAASKTAEIQSQKRQRRRGLRWWYKIRGISAQKMLQEWRTFIRRIQGAGSRGQRESFWYDPQSYSLNFDQGPEEKGRNLEWENEHGCRNFSARYASVPASGIVATDLGKDGPSFM
ncbi:unnamed protein product [Cuscuta epithymum]|uniref:Uncharacterized protein n=1 Tax=Cuscuta epithymum TaxID=186058 RepID=A0AAV0FY86_9ASTE|nr:unnamed protein product [Cuscuta epithymum]